MVLAASVAIAVAVQASASGGSVPKVPAVPKPSDLRAQAGQARVQAAAQPHVAATNVHCGQAIVATTTLNGDLDCTGQSGLTIGKASVTLNLGGHSIIGTAGTGTGVQTSFNSDTVENGYINGFYIGVQVSGTTDTVTKVQVNNATGAGIYLNGATDKATSNTAAENPGSGIYVDGSGATVQSNRAVNNGDGIGATGTGDKFLSNIANGNTADGFSVGPSGGSFDTFTGNTADFNDHYGISAASPVIDGGTNTAKGNTTPEQCRGVACS
jgi:parallel beta-helix repeat protein